MKIGGQKIKLKEYKNLVGVYSSAFEEVPILLEGLGDIIADDIRTEKKKKHCQESLNYVKMVREWLELDNKPLLYRLLPKYIPSQLRSNIRAINSVKSFLKEYNQYQPHLPLDL